MSTIDLSDILSASSIMMVSVTTVDGAPLPDDVLKQVMEGCDEGLALDQARRDILSYVQGRMTDVAPNVSAIVGSAIAAQLLGLAGSMEKLASIPACNLQVMGQEKGKNLAGFSTTSINRHAGVVFQCDLVQSAPRDLQIKAVRQVAGK